ncbi:MAG: response regulator transcription factor [Firmicutes bacterium]|nr:response regulator transcription factor [Bacillota bacterium]
MYKILIVDDEPNIRDIVAKYGEFEGYSVTGAQNGMEAVELVKNGKYDIVLMDVMMPELDGFSAVRKIRQFSQIPVIMLSARTEEYDKIHGFEIGADDYVTKPFSPKELMLRVNAILSRGKASEAKSDIYETDKLKVDFTARIVYVNGGRIELSPKEYELLFFLVRNKGIALSRERILSEVWGYDFYGDDRTLDTHIKLLRKSLGDASDYVVTLRGMGYRFET